MWVFFLLSFLFEIVESLAFHSLNIHVIPVLYMFCVHITVDNELLCVCVRARDSNERSRRLHTLLPFYWWWATMMSAHTVYSILFDTCSAFLHSLYTFFFHRFIIINWTGLWKEWSLHASLSSVGNNFAMHSLKLLWKSKLNCVILFMGEKKKSIQKWLYTMYGWCVFLYI